MTTAESSRRTGSCAPSGGPGKRWRVLACSAVVLALVTACGPREEQEVGALSQAPPPTAAPTTTSPPTTVAPVAAASDPTGCPTQGTDSSDYAMQIDWDPAPPRVTGSTLRVAVTRAGSPVVGARICFAASTAPSACNCVPAKSVRLDMTEPAPGLYEARPDFTVGGIERWGGSFAVFQSDTLNTVKQFAFETG